jgi:glucose/arabinose dehydrogenase
MRKKTFKSYLLLLLAINPLWSEAPLGYEIETIALPNVKKFNVAGMDVHPDGTVYLCTREGAIWKRSQEEWSRFAQGLHEPCGLKVVDHGNILVSQKPELTRVLDRNGDGYADRYESITTDFTFWGNYHEFHYGPIMDEKGNLFATLNLQTNGYQYQGNAMGSSGGYRGWLYQVKPDGTFIPFAYGLRSPAGIGWGPEKTILTTDNQGGWMGSSRLNVTEKGKFYGAPVSQIDIEGWTPDRVEKEMTVDDFDKLQEDPACWVPHIEIANSPGNPILDNTNGKFGPFGGDIFIGDQSNSNIFRAMLEKVNGKWQGAITNFITGLQCGAIRISFAPDGSLWVGQTARGWASKGGKPFGVQRITFDPEVMPFEIQKVNITPKGFKVTFTEPCDKKSLRDIHGSAYWYAYNSGYGSQKIRTESFEKAPYNLSEDGRTLVIDTNLSERLVFEFDLGKLKSKSGKSMVNQKFFYTVREIPTKEGV